LLGDLPEGSPFFCIRSFYCGWVGRTPMRENRLARPNRAGFPGVVTEGDDEIEWHIFELIPRFTVGIRCVDFEILAKNFQRERMRCGFRTRSGAVGFKANGTIFFNRYSAKILRAELPVQRNMMVKRDLLGFMGS
jgi:hypothetical protein